MTEEKRDYKKEAEIISKALAYAAEKHAVCKNNLRKDGMTPYIMHPLKVMQDMGNASLDYKLTALFHDLLEDTDATEEEILALSNERVLEAVKLLTKKKVPGKLFDEDAYIAKILKNPIAKSIKEADRICNLKETCFASPEFQNEYITNTWFHYRGKFGWALDNALKEAEESYAGRKDKPYIPQTATLKERAMMLADENGYIYYADEGDPIFRMHVEKGEY